MCQACWKKQVPALGPLQSIVPKTKEKCKCSEKKNIELTQLSPGVWVDITRIESVSKTNTGLDITMQSGNHIGLFKSHLTEDGRALFSDILDG